MTITWFKLDHHVIDDIKLRKFTPQEKWAWITLLCLSSQSDDRGLINAEIEDIADLCNYETQDFKYLLDKFKTKGMIDYSNGAIKIVNWEKRQHTKPSDLPESTRKRKAKQRAKQKAENLEMSRDVTPPVTRCHASVTRQIQIKDKDLDQDQDKDLDQIQKEENSETKKHDFFSHELSLENPNDSLPIEVEESIEGELINSDSTVSVQKSKTGSDLSGASAAQNPKRGALERAFGCKASSDPNFARFKRIYQGVLALSDGSGGWGDMRTSQEAWQDLVDEGAIDDLFWRGVEEYLIQQGHLRQKGKQSFPPGAAKFLANREWETALLRAEQQAAAKSLGLPDVGASKAEVSQAKNDAAMAEFRRIMQERQAC
jgi:hypothetical protein